MGTLLEPAQRQSLLVQHRGERDGRVKDRIKAVLLRDDGWSYERIAGQPRLRLHFLPAYSPNLNPIERLWKILHEHTVNNIYAPTFKIFTENILGFFNHTFPLKSALWVDRLTDNFTPRFSSLIANS